MCTSIGVVRSLHMCMLCLLMRCIYAEIGFKLRNLVKFVCMYTLFECAYQCFKIKVMCMCILICDIYTFLNYIQSTICQFCIKMERFIFKRVILNELASSKDWAIYQCFSIKIYRIFVFKDYDRLRIVQVTKSKFSGKQ